MDQTDVEKDMAGAAIKAVQEELEHNMDELKGFYKADAVSERVRFRTSRARPRKQSRS